MVFGQRGGNITKMTPLLLNFFFFVCVLINYTNILAHKRFHSLTTFSVKLILRLNIDTGLGLPRCTGSCNLVLQVG